MTQASLPSTTKSIYVKTPGQWTKIATIAELSDLEIQSHLDSGRCDAALRFTLTDELATRKTNAALARIRAENEFRMEVVAELVAEGKCEKVAMNLTDTEAKCLAQARRLSII